MISSKTSQDICLALSSIPPPVYDAYVFKPLPSDTGLLDALSSPSCSRIDLIVASPWIPDHLSWDGTERRILFRVSRSPNHGGFPDTQFRGGSRKPRVSGFLVT